MLSKGIERTCRLVRRELPDGAVLKATGKDLFVDYWETVA